MAEISARDQLQPVLWAIGMVSIFFMSIGVTDYGIGGILVWATILAIASLFEVPAKSGNRLSFAFAVAVAVPVVVGDSGGADLAAVFCVYSAGYLGGWMLARIGGREGHAIDSAAIRNSLGAGLYAFTFDGLSASMQGWESGPLVAFALAAVVWFVFEMGAWALTSYGRDRLSLSYLAILAFDDWPVSFSLYIVGALAGFSWSALRWWTLLVALPPFAFAYIAFQRTAEAQSTYDQTIRALSRIPEVAGLSPDGHSDRTAAMAVAIGQELGMTPHEIQDLEYASRMHDIGRITLNEPNILKAGFSEDDIARWGSEIISEARYLSNVATLVRLQHQPYRRPGEQKDPNVPLASKVIRASSAFDHAINEMGFSPLEALEVMHRGAAYDYDPDVVEAVRTVVDLGLVNTAAVR